MPHPIPAWRCFPAAILAVGLAGAALGLPRDALRPQLLQAAGRVLPLHAAAPDGYAYSEPLRVPPDAPVQQILVVGGEYAVDGKRFTVLAGLVRPGSLVRVRVPMWRKDAEPVRATLVLGVQRRDLLHDPAP